jgi:hypothetical protein
MNRTRTRIEAAVIVALVISAVLFVAGYRAGARNRARQDAEVAATHDLLIRTALLASDDSPRPVAIPYMGVEIAAFEKGVVVDTAKRDPIYAKEER